MAGIRYFPFAPGVPWKLRGGRYVVPEINAYAWNHALKDRDVVVALGHGGLFEAFASLSIMETVNCLSPGKTIYWAGNPKFNQLVRLNGLARLAPFDLPQELLDNYPVPLFLDQKRHAIFNCLNNYRVVKTYAGDIGYKDKRSAFRQIASNSTQSWSESYLPTFRTSGCPPELTAWAKVSRFHFTQPYVCIFPDRGVSEHHISVLRWNANHLKSFAALLRSTGITVVVCTNDVRSFYNSELHVVSPKIDNVIYLMQHAKAVLSEEVDYLLIANAVSNAALIARIIRGEFSLNKNNRFLGRQNVIYTPRELNPIDVANFIRGVI